MQYVWHRPWAANIGLQFDFYHVQIMDGDLIRNFDLYLDDIGHIQVSSVHKGMNRMMAKSTTLIFEYINASAYDGWIG